MLEQTWNINKNELKELLETATYTSNVDFNELEEDNFLLLKYTGNRFEIMDETNRFQYFQGKLYTI